MKYLFNSIVVVALGGAILASCNKREIIPAPEPKVDLRNHFIGSINGSLMEFTQNVNGFAGTSEVDLIINSGTLDSAVYLSSFSSTQTNQLVRVGHGSLVFDYAASDRPTLANFESFFNSGANLEPAFSIRGLNGFYFTYRDGQGRVWTSNATHAYADEKVVYTEVNTDSDKTGDYVNFKVDFSTYIYHTYQEPVSLIMITDSMLVKDATYTGWYKR